MIASIKPIVHNFFWSLSIFFTSFSVCFGRITIKRPSKIKSAAKIATVIVCHVMVFY